MRRLVSLLVLITFCFSNLSSSLVFAQTLNLPSPTQLLSVSPSYSFPVLRGLKLDSKNPLNIEFIIDPGAQKTVNKEEAGLLIKYFLAALTIPKENLWVNLSPYESSRIIPGPLSQTELGEDMLGQDYLLKQLASSMTYPESETGKAYWNDIQGRGLIHQTRDTTGMINHAPTNTFNRIWITADKAQIYEGKNVALITKSSLKALTEEDYLAMNKNGAGVDPRVDPKQNNISLNNGRTHGSAPTDAFKQYILPSINQEINQGKNFAQLRQIYNAVILGLWFKNKFQESFYKNYLNKETIKGIDTADKTSKDKIYNLYVEAFKKGVYNYVKKESVGANNYSPVKKITKRQYFSGGVKPAEGLPPEGAAITTDPAAVSGISGQPVVVAAAQMSPNVPAPIPAIGSSQDLRAKAEELAAQRNFVMPGGDPLRSSVRDALRELSDAETPQPPAVRSGTQASDVSASLQLNKGIMDISSLRQKNSRVEAQRLAVAAAEQSGLLKPTDEAIRGKLRSITESLLRRSYNDDDQNQAAERFAVMFNGFISKGFVHADNFGDFLDFFSALRASVGYDYPGAAYYAYSTWDALSKGAKVGLQISYLCALAVAVYGLHNSGVDPMSALSLHIKSTDPVAIAAGDAIMTTVLGGTVGGIVTIPPSLIVAMVWQRITAHRAKARAIKVRDAASDVIQLLESMLDASAGVTSKELDFPKLRRIVEGGPIDAYRELNQRGSGIDVIYEAIKKLDPVYFSALEKRTGWSDKQGNVIKFMRIWHAHTMPGGWRALSADEIARYQAEDGKRITIEGRELTVHRVWTGELAVTTCTPEQIQAKKDYLRECIFKDKQIKWLMDEGWVGPGGSSDDLRSRYVEPEPDPESGYRYDPYIPSAEEQFLARCPEVKDVIGALKTVTDKYGYDALTKLYKKAGKDRAPLAFSVLAAVQRIIHDEKDLARLGDYIAAIAGKKYTPPKGEVTRTSVAVRETRYEGWSDDYESYDDAEEIGVGVQVLKKFLERADEITSEQQLVSVIKELWAKPVVGRFQKFTGVNNRMPQADGDPYEREVTHDVRLLELDGRGVLAGFRLDRLIKNLRDNLENTQERERIVKKIIVLGSREGAERIAALVIGADQDGKINYRQASLGFALVLFKEISKHDADLALLYLGKIKAEADNSPIVGTNLPPRAVPYGLAIRKAVSEIKDEGLKDLRLSWQKGLMTAWGAQFPVESVLTDEEFDVLWHAHANIPYNNVVEKLSYVMQHAPRITADQRKWLIKNKWLGKKETADAVGGLTWDNTKIEKFGDGNFYFENIPNLKEVKSMGFVINGLYADKTIGQLMETVK